MIGEGSRLSKIRLLLNTETMQQQKSHPNIPLGVIASLSTLIVVVGSSIVWWNSHSRTKPLPPTEPVISQPSEQSTTLPNAEQTVQIYWVQDTGYSSELVASPMRLNLKSEPRDNATHSASDPDLYLQAVLNRLLAGPEDPTVTTTIPVGTKLRSLKVNNDGVYIDLSPEFASGGGTTSMTGRLGQIIYTATTLERDAPVWIFVEGEPLEYLGGGGLEVAQPMTRQIFEREFPLSR